MTRRTVATIVAYALAPLCASNLSFAETPAAVAAPDEIALLTAHAQGAQIYECKAGADGKPSWSFREPIASLFENGQTIGRHFRGPTWELVDSSLVTGKVIGDAPGATPQDIPWLKLEVVTRFGTGKLTGATTIQRINTKGGVLQGDCPGVGAFFSAPYATDYVFLKKAN